LEPTEFSKLEKLEKDSNNNMMELPPKGAQKYFKLHGKFVTKEKFDTILSRTGHINKNKLTIILNSKSHGPMMRFDIIGTDHEDIPTPHLHIFNSDDDIIGQTVLSSNELPTQLKACLKDLSNVVENFTLFLKFINVDLSDVQITANLT